MTTRYSASVEVLAFDSIRVLEATSTSYTCYVNSVTVSEGDFIVNMTQSENPPIRYGDADSCRRKIISATGSSFMVTASIDGQTTGDIIAVYKYKDVTQYLKDGTLQMDLSSKGNNEANFSFEIPTSRAEIFMHNGGWNETYIYSYNIGFTVLSEVWTVYENMPVFNSFHNSFKGNEENILYIAQGQSYDGGWIQLDDCYMYDLSEDAWYTQDTLSIEKRGCSSATIGENSYVVGGFDPVTYYDILEVYDQVGDAWSALTASSVDVGVGAGVNLCEVFFVGYFANFGGLNENDIYYIPYTDSWHDFFVDHNAPDRDNTGVSFKGYDFKAGIVGGCNTYGGDPLNAIDTHTFINFIAKIYYESLEWPTNIQGVSSGTFEGFGFVTGGVYGDEGDHGSYFDTSYLWISNTEEVWATTYDLPAQLSYGRGVAI